MRVVIRRKAKITKKDFEELLGYPVKDLRFKDSYFQAILTSPETKDEISVYLRCGDLKSAFDFPFNVLDAGIKPLKNKTGFQYFYEEEVTKSGFRKSKLRRIIADLM